jgi:hypothetical protein
MVKIVNPIAYAGIRAVFILQLLVSTHALVQCRIFEKTDVSRLCLFDQRPVQLALARNIENARRNLTRAAMAGAFDLLLTRQIPRWKLNQSARGRDGNEWD